MSRFLFISMIAICLFVLIVLIANQVTNDARLLFATLPALVIFLPVLFAYLILASSTTNRPRGQNDAACTLGGKILPNANTEIANLRNRFELIHPNPVAYGAVRCTFEQMPLTVYSYKEVSRDENGSTTFAYAALVGGRLVAPNLMICRRTIGFRLAAIGRPIFRREISAQGSMLETNFFKRFAVLGEPDDADFVLDFLTDERIRRLLERNGKYDLEISQGELLLVRHWGLMAALQNGFSSQREIEAREIVRLAGDAMAVFEFLS